MTEFFLSFMILTFRDARSHGDAWEMYHSVQNYYRSYDECSINAYRLTERVRNELHIESAAICRPVTERL